MAKGGYVYIMTNFMKTVLYIGVTSDLEARVSQHKEGHGSKFTHKYNCKYLVYYKFYNTIVEAIEQEKRMKKWKREFKENVINNLNPEWEDLWHKIEGVH